MTNTAPFISNTWQYLAILGNMARTNRDVRATVLIRANTS